MTETVTVSNLEIEYETFSTWFQDEHGNCYHDIMYTGDYSNGSVITVDYKMSGNVRVVLGASKT